MSLTEEEDYEKLAYVQRLKAAVHFTVGQICEETGTSCDVTFNKQFIAALSETTFRYCQTMARDAELFARHAKRSTINTEDVKLLVRKSPPLLTHIQEKSEQQQATLLDKKQKRTKKKQTKSSAANPQGEDEDSNVPG